jgi:acyl-CoA reductase-like NAD-dependent aldehyde dehydrogenase
VADRLPVKKTYKLYIGGAFPRSESGRTFEAEGQNVARASRKDVRDAVRAARDGYGKWSVMTAYNRGQVLYRVAEMMEARRDEFAAISSGKKEVDRAIDRMVWYAGWADKLPQVLGGRRRPVLQLHRPRPTGVVGVRSGRARARGLVSRIAPLVGGNAVVAVASETHPLLRSSSQKCSRHDVPGGAVNCSWLPGGLAPWLAGHMDVSAVT